MESSFLSLISLGFTVASDVEASRTRLFDPKAPIVIGEPTATALTTYIIGQTPIGLVDALADKYATDYAHGKAPGVYEKTGIKGAVLELPNLVPGLLAGLFQTFFNVDLGLAPFIQFGDK